MSSQVEEFEGMMRLDVMILTCSRLDQELESAQCARHQCRRIA
jgi:hypothetical protein